MQVVLENNVENAGTTTSTLPYRKPHGPKRKIASFSKAKKKAMATNGPKSPSSYQEEPTIPSKIIGIPP